MSEPTTARDAMLKNIRGERARPDQVGAPDNPRGNDVDRSYSAIPRNYLHRDLLDLEDRLYLFEQRLREYDAGVYQATASSLPSIIARVLSFREKSSIAVPQGIAQGWMQHPATFVTDAVSYSTHALDALDGVLTGCTVAIALTGTIVLQHTQAQGPRRLTLVPDYHLCVVFAEQIVGTVPEAFERLAATGTLPTTFISGPSATADIEMTRVKGVHGPRFFDVIIVS